MPAYRAVIYWKVTRKVNSYILKAHGEATARKVAETMQGPGILDGGARCIKHDTAERIDLYAADRNGHPLCYLSSFIRGEWVANNE